MIKEHLRYWLRNWRSYKTNKKLFQGETLNEEEKELVKNIDSTIIGFTPKEDITLYRVIHVDDFEGIQWIHNGFSTFTTNEKKAISWTWTHYKTYVLGLRLKAGKTYNAVNINDQFDEHALRKAERNEVIFARGLKLKPIQVHKGGRGDYDETEATIEVEIDEKN